MGLRNVFSKSKPDADPLADAPVLVDTAYVHARDGGAFALATVLSERYAEHEGQAIESDLLSAAERCGHRLVVDLSKVLMLASAGIGSLIKVHQTCAGKGGKLAICNIDPNITQMLKIAKMDRLFVLADTPADAATRIA